MILKIIEIITPFIIHYGQTGNQDQQVDQMFFILLGTVPVNGSSNTTARISF